MPVAGREAVTGKEFIKNVSDVADAADAAEVVPRGGR